MILKGIVNKAALNAGLDTSQPWDCRESEAGENDWNKKIEKHLYLHNVFYILL